MFESLLMACHWFSLFYVVYAMYCMINETIPLVTMVWMNETIILIYVMIHDCDNLIYKSNSGVCLSVVTNRAGQG